VSDIETGMMLYLNHVTRQLKEDETFEPHPIMKAIALALEAAKNNPDGNYLGLSGIPADETSFKEMYGAVINKKRDRYTIVSIQDFALRHEIPADVVVQLLHISMRLDKFDGESVGLSEAVTILNDIIDDVTFKVLPSEEIEDAKRNFVEQVRAGKVIIPKKFKHLAERLKSFRMETPWEELDPSIRSIIGTLWASKKYPNRSTVIITRSVKTIKKYRVIEIAKSRLHMQ